MEQQRDLLGDVLGCLELGINLERFWQEGKVHIPND
jgi:hypothetical protein